MAATYARTVAAGPVSGRAGTVGRRVGATVAGWSGVVLLPASVTSWSAAAGGMLAECGEPERRTNPTEPSIITSASASTGLQPSRRRPDVGTAVNRSSRLTADKASGTGQTSSYSRINGSGSAPTAPAMLRMYARAYQSPSHAE